MLATPGTLPPENADRDYAYEVKWDGVRAVAYLDGSGSDGFRLVSRNDHDITAAYPELRPSDAVAACAAVLDGEIVAFDRDGNPSFAALQTRMHVREPGAINRLSAQTPVAYIVFDLMYLDGRDLTDLGYRERREVLRSLAVDRAPAWECPDYQVGGGTDLDRATRDRGLEGVLAKRLDAPYRPGRRSPAWIKIKHVLTQEVVVGGWTPGEGRRASSFGALLLGVPGDGGALTYVGHVGTGFSDAALDDLTGRLHALAAGRSPFTGPMPAAIARPARWVRPDLVGEVSYTRRTRDGVLRTPAWRGLRPDKAPRDVREE
jgi:bifunctional non-homologous end joining protein LigD